MDAYNFHLVKDIAQLRKLVDICVQRKLCSLDLETTGVDNRVYPDEYFEDGIKTRHGMRTIDRIAGVCISFDGKNGYYVPLSHEPEDSGNLPWDPAWDEISRIVYECRTIFHNAKFDCEFLYPVTGKDFYKTDEYEDTYLLSKIISPLKSVPSGLKQLTKLHFGVDMLELDDLFTPELVEQLKREKRSTKNFAVLHPKEGTEYGASDGIFTYKLWPILREKVSDGDLKLYNLEKSFCNVIRELERNRVHIDVERVQQLNIECKAELDRVGDIIRDVIESRTGKTGKWLTLNVGSTKQLSAALLTDPEGLKLKPTPEMIEALAAGGVFENSDDDDDDEEDEEAKQYSLKDEAVKSLHRVYGEKFLVQREGHTDKEGKPKKESMFELILEWRHYQKMKGSYVEKLVLAVDKNGDVRPSFNQMGTDTTRLSCKADKIENGYSGVNFQGIPRDSDEDKPELFKQIRTVIVPRPGWILVKLDFAGEELRVVTNLSGDPIWTKSFLYEDGDVHSITARTLFGKQDVNKDERNRGKRCNFAFIYGGGAGAIQRNIGCSIEDASRHMENLKKDVPVLMGYVDHQKAYARKNKCIYTAFGRRIPIPTIDSPIRAIRSKAERCAINYTIQATSADILKFAMCFVDKQLRTLGWKDRCRYVLTVHDEVVFEIKPEFLMEIVRKLDEWMTFPWKLPKAHGREWVVPLLTEPGIDINWKARYNYFEMVDGVPADPKLLDEDGNFTGKLKKGQYFADGRIYQEIPDWLKPWIHRIPPAGKTLEAPPDPPKVEAPAQEAPQLQEPGPSAREAIGLSSAAEDVAVIRGDDAKKILADIEKVAPKEELDRRKAAAEKFEAEITNPDKPVRNALVQLSPEPAKPVDISLDADPEPLSLGETSDAEPVQDNSEFKTIDLDDIDLDSGDGFGSDIAVAPPSPKEASESQEAPSAPKANGKPEKANGKPKDESFESGQVLRWTIRAVLSEQTMRKLHAVCILTEGDIPLRVISPHGSILIGEDTGILVDPSRFKILAEMFGLG